MNDLRTYIVESERTYSFRVKTLVPLNDTNMDKLEYALLKYQPIDVTRPRRTILQRNPLDFATVDEGEVWIVDVTTRLPTAAYIMQQELRNALNCAEKFIVVRGDNEPIELEGEALAAMREIEQQAGAEGLSRRARLSTDPNDYHDDEKDQTGTLFGNEYNRAFLDYLYQVQQQRKSMQVEPKDPLFKWIDMPKETHEPKQVDGNFNGGIDGIVQPASLSKEKGSKPDPRMISPHGNLDNDYWRYTRAYIDRKGRSHEISRDAANIRKEGK